MQISTSTVLLFMALTPGLFFLIGLKSSQKLLTAREIFSSQIHELLLLLVVSAFSSIFTLGLASIFFPEGLNSTVISIHELDTFKVETASTDLASIIKKAFLPCFLFAGTSYLIAFVIGKIYPRIYFRVLCQGCENATPNDDLKRFLYLVKNTDFVFAWICTNTSHEGKYLIYYGLVKDVRFENDEIKQVLLGHPQKTYMDFDLFLKTSHQHDDQDKNLPRKLLPPENNNLGTFLYIPNSSIVNICFQKISGTAS